ncbi:hypothetical protein HRI_004473300 [Hibiscus trionum]|uniref:RRM domain-containing protein n=1 Tax=Hibiscus trionum TaxID=183268 RepID=A0A9W7J4Y5_HIBTR|nr:hypothetical protein HRI_004473300 [Hibiscus trionum]
MGFSVFIDNLSKNIHIETLKRSLALAGEILDVYVAYNNPKRRARPTTLAFVRFRDENAARRAIRENNGRWMDRYRIKMFEAKSRTIANQAGIQKPGFNATSPSHGKPTAMKDHRSFKDVLLGINKEACGCVGESMNAGKNDLQGGENIGIIMVEFGEEDSIESRTGENDSIIKVRNIYQSWKNNALVGLIKEAYNPALIQDVLRSEGMSAIVCPWYGRLVIIRFSTREDKERCWLRRKNFMESWFNELEHLEGFDGKRRIKVWVILKDVPLQVWSQSFFTGLGGRWGQVLELDEETKEMSRFDEARMVVAVKKLSVIPNEVRINVNGVISKILIETKEYEEDFQFLDGGRPVNGDGYAYEEPMTDSEIEDSLMKDGGHDWNNYCHQVGQGDNLAGLQLVSKEKLSGINDENSNSQGAQVSSSDARLVEVPIGSDTGLVILGQTSMGRDGSHMGQPNETMRGAEGVLARQDSRESLTGWPISNESNLQEVQVALTEAEIGDPFFTSIRGVLPNTEQEEISIYRGKTKAKSMGTGSDANKLGAENKIQKKGEKRRNLRKKNKKKSTIDQIAEDLDIARGLLNYSQTRENGAEEARKC